VTATVPAFRLRRFLKAKRRDFDGGFGGLRKNIHYDSYECINEFVALITVLNKIKLAGADKNFR
jgi:hypothetical protein